MTKEDSRLQKLKKIAQGFERQRSLKAHLDFQAKVEQKPTYKSPRRRKLDDSPILKPSKVGKATKEN